MQTTATLAAVVAADSVAVADTPASMVTVNSRFPPYVAAGVRKRTESLAGAVEVAAAAVACCGEESGWQAVAVAVAVAAVTPVEQERRNTVSWKGSVGAA